MNLANAQSAAMPRPAGMPKTSMTTPPKSSDAPAFPTNPTPSGQSTFHSAHAWPANSAPTTPAPTLQSR